MPFVRWGEDVELLIVNNLLHKAIVSYLLSSSMFVFNFWTDLNSLRVWFCHSLHFATDFQAGQQICTFKLYKVLFFRKPQRQWHFLLRFWILCRLFYYKQSDLFREAPQDREARAPPSEGKTSGRGRLCFVVPRFPKLFTCQWKGESLELFPSLVSLSGRKLLYLPQSS